MARSLGWSGTCTAMVLVDRYGIPAEDGLDLMVLEPSQTEDLKQYLTELSHDWIGEVLQ
jgi:hypothetical protein